MARLPLCLRAFEDRVPPSGAAAEGSAASAESVADAECDALDALAEPADGAIPAVADESEVWVTGDFRVAGEIELSPETFNLTADRGDLLIPRPNADENMVEVGFETGRVFEPARRAPTTDEVRAPMAETVTKAPTAGHRGMLLPLDLMDTMRLLAGV